MHQNLAEKIRRRWTSTQKVVGNEKAHRMFVGAKDSLARLSDVSNVVNGKILPGYQTVECELWGEVLPLPEGNQPARKPGSTKLID